MPIFTALVVSSVATVVCEDPKFCTVIEKALALQGPPSERTLPSHGGGGGVTVGYAAPHQIFIGCVAAEES